MNVLVLCRYRQCLSSTTCLWTYLPDLILRNFTLVWKVRGNTVSNKMYKVEWEGGHQSSYPLEWLKERSFREEARTLYREKVINQACGCPPKIRIKFFWALHSTSRIIYWGNWFPKILAMSIDASWCFFCAPQCSVSKWEKIYKPTRSRISALVGLKKIFFLVLKWGYTSKRTPCMSMGS